MIRQALGRKGVQWWRQGEKIYIVFGVIETLHNVPKLCSTLFCFFFCFASTFLSYYLPYNNEDDDGLGDISHAVRATATPHNRRWGFCGISSLWRVIVNIFSFVLHACAGRVIPMIHRAGGV